MRRALMGIAICVVVAACGGQSVAPQHSPKDRYGLVMLFEKGGVCHARAPKKIRAYEADTVVWEIANECSTAKRVDIVFPGQNPVTWVGDDHVNIDPGATKELKATVKAGTSGRAYPYMPKVDGATGADPDLEIDPF